MIRPLALLLVLPLLLAAARSDGSGDWPGYRPRPPAIVAPVPSPVPRITVPVIRTSTYAGSVAALIRSTFGAVSPKALCIAQRESGLNPTATNGQFKGVFQLGAMWYDGFWHFDPLNASLNVHYAYLLYLRDGWRPWTTAGGC